MYTASWWCCIVAPVDWRCPVASTTARRCQERAAWWT